MFALVGSLLVLGSVVTPPADPPTVCVALARSEMSSGVDLSTALRDAVVDGLRAVAVHAVPLDTGMDGAVMEGSQKNCAFLVLTRVKTQGGSGLMQRMSNMRKLTAAMPHSSPQGSPAPSSAVSLATAEESAIKRGDQISVDYELTPGRALTAIKSGKLDAKARADGEDVLGPLVTQLAGTVASAAGSGADAAGTPTPSAADTTSRRGGRSRDAAPSMPKDMNCEQIAAQSHGSVTVAACQQMLGAQQAFDKAANDPSASRPDDDRMTCDQIAAEMKQQQFTRVDQAKVAEAQAATSDFQQKAAEEQKKGEALAAKESAEMSLAGRLAVTNAAAAAASEKIAAEQKANNERVEKEMTPKAERMVSSSAALIGDAVGNMTANPRVARLAQLAMKKGCKVQ